MRRRRTRKRSLFSDAKINADSSERNALNKLQIGLNFLLSPIFVYKNLFNIVRRFRRRGKEGDEFVADAKEEKS